MLPIRIIFVVYFAVSLTACGALSNEKDFAHLNTKMTQPLQMPDGMQAPQGGQPVLVPQVRVDTIDLTNDLIEPPQIVKSVDLAELDNDQPGQAKQPDSVSPSQAEPTRVALLSNQTRTSEGKSILVVDGEFDTVWPLVEPALKELGFTIDDSSRGAQVYTISKELLTVRVDDEPEHPGDEKPPVKEEYQIHLNQVAEKTQISVHNKYGELESSGLSDHLLLQIKEILANPKQQSQDGG